MSRTILYGLIGYPLSHSFSATYFNEKFFREGIPDSRYELFEIEAIDELPHLLEKWPALRGLNVTIPYKESIIPYLDFVDPHAAAVGAVNCVKVLPSRLEGYNTDIIGFRQSIEPLLAENINSALILGIGGAAKAVAYVLHQLEIPYTIVSRSPSNADEIGYAGLDGNIVAGSKLIINTTPLGMYPATDASPAIPFQAIGPQHLCFDLVYNPPKTLFLINCEKQGAIIKNGLEMLYLQAEASWQVWND